MNLAVKDLLYRSKKRKGKWCNNEDDKREGSDIDDDAPRHENDLDNDKKRKEALRKAWRALRIVGKAHNIIL